MLSRTLLILMCFLVRAQAQTTDGVCLLTRRTFKSRAVLDQQVSDVQSFDVEQKSSEVQKDKEQKTSEVQKDMEQTDSKVWNMKREIRGVGRQRFSMKPKERSYGKPVYRYGEHNRQWEYMPGLKPAVSWIVSPYNQCLQAEDGTASKERKVQCLDVFDMERSDSRSCQPDKRPCHSRACTCPGLEVCGPLEKETVESECSIEDHPIDNGIAYEEMGCLESVAVANTSEFFDYTCMTASDETCRDGLPWFSRVLPVMTPVDCLSFCTGKGLDLFGILGGKECRCGASNANMATFHEETPRKALLFNKRKLIPCFFTHNIKVFRYIGPLQDTGVPVGFLAHTGEDMQYIFSVVSGTIKEYEGQMEDGGPREISDAPSLVQELPHCPDCNYKPIWPTRSETPPQIPWPYLEFKDYVIVPYRWATQGEQFGPDEIKQDMDDVRKDAYRSAVKEIMKKTCIVFVERTKAELEASGEGYVAVGVAVYPGCWAYAGYNGARPRLLSLGWCNSGAFQGSMIHESLHSLGIAHMQKRPDATQNIEGHGPYLHMYWDQISDGWKPQYTAQQGMYMGSQYDGEGDPFVGWAPYDYGSIMHYSASSPKAFDTIPEGHVTGQRTELSSGDISMLNDLYQCKTKGASATPVPTPTPTRAIPATYPWWLKEGPCGQSEDLSCITSPNYPSAYSSSQKCEIDVKNLQAESISLEDWNTELKWDTLTVNGQSYSGSSKPDQVVPAPDSNIIWTSDSSTEAKGWKMCLTAAPHVTPPPAPVAAPTPPVLNSPVPTPVPPTPAPSASWTIISGDCEVSAGNSQCLESPNYPEHYDNSAKCTVRVTEPSGPIRIEDWDTESYYDKLTVNSNNYAMKRSSRASTSPYAELDGVVPAGDLVWSSDSSQTKKGWKICAQKQGPTPPSTPAPPTPALTTAPTPEPTPAPTFAPTLEPTPEPTPVPTPEPTPAPTSAPTSAPTPRPAPATPVPPTPPSSASWVIMSGDCEVSPGNSECLESPNYPQKYDTSENCNVRVTERSGPIRVEDWNTESTWDTLTVNNKKYAMKSSERASTTRFAELDGVVPTGDLVWSSDSSQTSKGWKICAEKQLPTPAPPEPAPGPPTLAPPPASWRVTKGQCKEQEDHRCISSTNYPQPYSANDNCLIQVQVSGTVQVLEFDTEGRTSSSCWDWLEVESNRYCNHGTSGSKELDGVKVSAGTIEWSSDFSTQQKGWKICLT